MPADSLLAVLARDAEEEAQRILADADAEARVIHERAAERLAAARDARVAERAARIGRDAERRRAAVTHDARAAILAAQWRFVDRVLDVVRGELPCALDGPDGEAVTVRLLEEALAFLPEGKGTVSCPPHAVDVVRALVPPGRDLDVVGREDVRSGVRVESADGRLVVDNTLDERLAHLTPQLAAVLVRRESERA